MDIPTREQLETRMHAIVADHLDQIAEENPEGFDLGIIALAVEVITPDPEGTWIRREEGGYWPPMDINMHQHLYCTDWRRWVKKAFFRNAWEYFEYPPSEEENELEALSAQFAELEAEASTAIAELRAAIDERGEEDGEVED